jgi:hypothetical protein
VTTVLAADKEMFWALAQWKIAQAATKTVANDVFKNIEEKRIRDGL